MSEIKQIMVVATKSSGVGIVLSFFWSGLGQLYAGEIGRGIGIMIATPILWMIGFFGGLGAMFGSLGVVAGAMKEEAATGAAGAGVGLVGIIMALIPIVWWVWAMIDAKNLCEAFNQKVMANPEKVQARS